MRQINRYVGILNALILAGCASTGGIAPNRSEISRLKDSGTAEVRAITFAPAKFTLLSSKKAAAGGLFGILGGAVAANSMQKAGEEMLVTYGIVDPAIAVREKVSGTLMSEYGLRASLDSAPASDDITMLKARFGTGTILDTRTTGWALSYYPSDWGHHFLIYSGRASLRQLSDGKVLWEGKCKVKLSDAKGSRRTVDEYRANNGALLKQKIQEGTNGCADDLIAKLSGKATKP